MERVVRNALAKNIHRLCSGSRAGCKGISSQATRLPLQDYPATRLNALAEIRLRGLAFSRAWGTREICSRVPKQLITDHRSTSLTVGAAESDEAAVME